MLRQTALIRAPRVLRLPQRCAPWHRRATTGRRGPYHHHHERLLAVERLLAPALVVAAAVLVQTITSHEERETATRRLHRHHASSSIITTTTACEFMSMPRFLSGRAPQSPTPVEFMDREAKPTDDLHRRYDLSGFDSSIMGVGAFGAVGRALCRETGRPVALKKLPKASTSDAAVARELQALIQIRQAGGHPNLNAFREHFDDETHDAYYLVLDVVEGGELFDALCRDGPMCEADAARFTRQLGSALQFLHSLELVHMDLKPENLLLSQPDAKAASVKLVDFGCCRPSTESKKNVNFAEQVGPDGSTRVNVTPEYCPPEVLAELQKAQALGEDMSPHITPSYDMWSLGVILFVMLVGAHPFDLKGNASDEDIAHNILESRFVTKTPEWKEHIKGSSPEVKDLLERLMHPDPKHRMTAEELLKSDWVRGTTSTSSKLSGSDRRLAAYRKHQTRVAAQFFKQMLEHTKADSHNADQRTKQSSSSDSIFETAFKKLEAGRGYISSKELHGDKSLFGADAKLNMAEITHLLTESHMKEHYFPAGHVIYKEGDPGDSMYFLHSGTLQAKSKDGFIKDKQAGDFFGEDVLSGSEENKYAFTAECITPVHAIEILRKDYNKYLAHDEDLALMMEEHRRRRRRERARVMLSQAIKPKRKTCAEGDIIFERGSSGTELYILLEGRVELSVNGHKVRNLRLRETMGEHAIYYGNRTPHNNTAQCTSDSCVLGVLTAKELNRAFDKNAELRDSFRDLMLRRDFRKSLCAYLGRSFPETESEMKTAFVDLAHIPKYGPLVMDLDSLRKMVKSFDPSYKEEDILSMLKSMDLTGNGTITWSEFKTIVSMSQES